MPMARVDCAWAAPQAQTLTPRPVAASHRLHTPDPSTGGPDAACSLSDAAAWSLGRIMGLARGQSKRYGRSSIRGNQMNLGGPSAAGLTNGVRAVFF